MADFHYDLNTEKVSFDIAPDSLLADDDKRSANETATLINTLYTNLKAYDGEVPPLNAFSQNISVSASKLAKSGVEALQKKKFPDAVKLLSTALEMVLRRPIWESMPPFLEEVSQCLRARCDAYVALKQWPDAYGDASLLLLMKPDDHLNFYRMGMIMAAVGRLDEAQNHIKTALSMAPNNQMYTQTLKAMTSK